MKKLLLVSTAIAGVAMLATPASAALKMDLGGYFEGYGLYAENHEPAGAANSLQKFEFRRDSEVHFNGETTLDNGLTVGAHSQLNLATPNGSATATTTLSGTATGGGGTTLTGNAGTIAATTNVTSTNATLVDETYLYGSGGWGRVNFGDEDGAAYLLQVAAPSADSNVDGMRVYIQGLNTANWNANLAGLVLNYQQADFRQTDRLTYLTPKFNGFQAGVSYAPKPGTPLIGSLGYTSGTSAMANDQINGQFKNPWEAAARWDGEFSGVALSVGGGYSEANNETGAVAPAAGAAGSANFKTWNGGANVAFSGFSLGGAYKHSNNGISTNGTTRIWDVGAGYDNGPYHAGVSYYHESLDDGLLSVADTSRSTIHRYAVGGGYTFGPGMTFRGSVDWGKFKAGAPDAADVSTRFTQATLGTDIQF